MGTCASWPVYLLQPLPLSFGDYVARRFVCEGGYAGFGVGGGVSYFRVMGRVQRNL